MIASGRIITKNFTTVTIGVLYHHIEHSVHESSKCIVVNILTEMVVEMNEHMLQRPLFSKESCPEFNRVVSSL